MKPLQFREQSIKEFNFYQDTQLKEDMSFHEAISEIEDKEYRYYYTSLAEEDVQEAYENEYEIARQLELDPIYITELGIYIVL